jgi:hypothetical protein
MRQRIAPTGAKNINPGSGGFVHLMFMFLAECHKNPEHNRNIQIIDRFLAH